MTTSFKTTYFAPASQGYRPADGPFLRTPLRLNREGFSESSFAPTYGDYLQDIREVVCRDAERLCDAVGARLDKDVAPGQIEEIRIYAEKHGSDYHPARVEVVANGTPAAFVMNVAVTERGRLRLYREFEVLKELNKKFDAPFLPTAYFRDEGIHPQRCGGLSDTNSPPLVMFLADWFEGYHEFHLSVDKTDRHQKLLIWDTRREAHYLPDTQAAQIYAQIAEILTGYYDLKTFRQIFPWHHAAGDFIVRTTNEASLVRLVTARQYAPMVEEMGIYDALLFFLLNLSLRTRLDRLDGVGKVVWAEDACVGATLAGFFQGLTLNGREAEHFLAYLRQTGKEGLRDRFAALVDACNPNAPDMPVIRENLNHHVSVFHGEIQRLHWSPGRS